MHFYALLYIMFKVTNNMPANLIFIFQIDYMMSSSIFLLCCLLILSLYSLSQHTGYSLDATATRKLSMPAPLHYHETQGADKPSESTPANEEAIIPDYTRNSYGPHDLVYHIDYHGVTTHPTPKHPKP